MLQKIVFFSISFLLLLSACSIKDDINIKKHKVVSEDLTYLRNELTMVVFDRLKSELERDDIRRRHAIKIAKELKSLSEMIKEIPKDRLKRVKTANDKKRYGEYREQLYRDADAIYKVAEAYELEKLPTKLESMKRTCKGCHKDFRMKD